MKGGQTFVDTRKMWLPHLQLDEITINISLLPMRCYTVVCNEKRNYVAFHLFISASRQPPPAIRLDPDCGPYHCSSGHFCAK